MVTRRALALVLCVALLATGVTLWALRPAGFTWADLWLTPDQQGRRHFERGDFASAALHFRDPSWKGVACFRAHDLECATQAFSRVTTAEGEFNLGVVQAHAAQLPAALAAFEHALALRPGWSEASENRDLLARVLAQKREDGHDEAAGEPNDEPDDMKVDEKGKRGKRGAVEIEKLGPDAIDQLWLRNVRTDPAQFLRARFAAEAQARTNAGGKR